MTQDTRPRPAWAAGPSARVTLPAAEPGAFRTDANGCQWYLDTGHVWRPVVHKPEPEREAGS
jgi:hypothetical protein